MEEFNIAIRLNPEYFIARTNLNITYSRFVVQQPILNEIQVNWYKYIFIMFFCIS